MASRHVNYVLKPCYVLEIKDKNDTGKVIGKGGSKIRELEDLTGAKITVNSAQSTVSIFGSEQSAIDAKFLVQRIIGGPNNRILKNLDEKSIKCISQDGEWLEKLQNSLDVYIEISARDVIIEADDEMIENLDEAERQIQRKIETMLEFKTVLVTLRSPSQLAEVFADPMLIALRDTHGLEMETLKTDAGTGVSLCGSSGIVDEAKNAIEALVFGGGKTNFVILTPGMLAECDDDMWNDLNADFNERICRDYSVLVNCQRSSDRILLSTTNEEDDLKNPTRVCQEILMYYFPDRCCLFYCKPIQALGSVLGRDDAELVRMSNRECVLSVDRDRGQIWICGSPKFVTNAATRFNSNLNNWKETNVIIKLADERCKGFIVGTGGERLRQIQTESGCSVTCDGPVVHISGPSQAYMDEARRMVNDSVQQWQDRKARGATYQSGRDGGFPPTPGRGRGFPPTPGRGGGYRGKFC